MLTMLRLDDIKDDGNSVLIIVSDEALVSISGIGANDSISLIAALSRFVVWDDYASARRKRKSCRFLLLLMHH